MKRNYVVEKWFAWRPVNINSYGELPKIVWLKTVARWWHPQIGLFGCWIYADWHKLSFLHKKRLGDSQTN